MMRFSRFAAVAMLTLVPLVVASIVAAGLTMAGEPDSVGAAAEKRVALVVGNADYRLSPLAHLAQ